MAPYVAINNGRGCSKINFYSDFSMRQTPRYSNMVAYQVMRGCSVIVQKWQIFPLCSEPQDFRRRHCRNMIQNHKYDRLVGCVNNLWKKILRMKHGTCNWILIDLECFGHCTGGWGKSFAGPHQYRSVLRYSLHRMNRYSPRWSFHKICWKTVEERHRPRQKAYEESKEIEDFEKINFNVKLRVLLGSCSGLMQKSRRNYDQTQ
jgi:hypothetical protein